MSGEQISCMASIASLGYSPQGFLQTTSCFLDDPYFGLYWVSPGGSFRALHKQRAWRGFPWLASNLHLSHSLACPRGLQPPRGHPMGPGGRSPPCRHRAGSVGSWVLRGAACKGAAGSLQDPQHPGLQNRALSYKNAAPSWACKGSHILHPNLGEVLLQPGHGAGMGTLSPLQALSKQTSTP